MALTLKAPGTFWGKVKLTLPGGAAATLRAEFRHMARTEVAEFIKAPDRGDVDTLMAIMVGWNAEDIDAPFSRESIETLCDQYVSAPRQILETWLAELTQARLGN
jgi:hypothetical protein